MKKIKKKDCFLLTKQEKSVIILEETRKTLVKVVYETVKSF